VRKVFAVLKRLRSEGLALLYISHRMQEIAELADECTVFRTATMSHFQIRRQERFRDRRDDDRPRIQPRLPAETRASIPRQGADTRSAGLVLGRRLKNISLNVRAGEIVGLGGLDGQGQRELLLALFGVLRGMSGEVLIDGKKIPLTCPSDAKCDAVAWRSSPRIARPRA